MSDDSMNTKPAGHVLKTAREAAGLSVSDVSTATKINSKVLLALEEGQLDELPAKSFTRGFIRVYSQYLKVDAQPIIDAYDMEDPFLSTLGKELEKKDSPETPPSERMSGIAAEGFGKKPFVAGAIIILIVVVLMVKRVFDKYSQETVLPTTAQTESGTVLLNEVGTEKSELTENAPNIVENDGDASEKNSDKTPEPQQAIEPTATPVPTPTPEPTAKSTPTPSPTLQPTATPTPKPTKAAEQKKQPQKLIIEALDQVTVSVKVDGGKSKEVKLVPGAIFTIDAEEGIELDVSDGGLVNISLNGKDQGVAGDLGRRAKLKFP